MAAVLSDGTTVMLKKAKNPNADAIRRGERLPELLAPAGSYTALMAAIEGGADAVYMGGVAFNARINAKNFTEEELKRGIAIAHSYGVKVYIAANTLIYDREVDGFLRAAEYAYHSGADALIVADMGAAAEVKKRIPIELHASTQCSGHGLDAAMALEKVGFSRMVCAREMSREDIDAFVESSPLEAEVFVHGALCVCHSGQCLFSSLVGGRSGNRGECAQPCRLPFGGRGGNQYPLSLKDLTLAAHIPELCDMGVSSLKIEGRMKSPEYVRDVTSIWRRLLDEKKAATYEDIRELDGVFSRGGFTDAYFTRSIGRKMLGVRSEEQKQISRTLEPFSKITRKLPIDMKMSVIADQPMKLTVSDGSRSVTVTGDIPQAARTAPIDGETVKRSLIKLGETPYSAQGVDIELEQGLIVPISALNAIRRKAIDALIDVDTERQAVKQVAGINKPQGKRTNMRTAVFYDPRNIPESAYSYFDIIYTPLEKYTGNTNGIILPPVIFDSERDKIKKMLASAKALGASDALVGNLGHIDMVKDFGMTVHGDIRLNVCNNSTAEFFESLGIEDVVLSPELTLAQIRDIGGRTSACVYGRIPLMITEKCVGKEIGDCRKCADGKAVLTDRRGVTFPVQRAFEHRSLIFNSVPFYMADKSLELHHAGVTMQHFIFTVENAKQADEIIQAYKNGRPPKDPTQIKRIK